MTFPHNSLHISNDELDVEFIFDTKKFLLSISRNLPKDIKIVDAENDFWKQKCQALECINEYDWTFWSDHNGKCNKNDWIAVFLFLQYYFKFFMN